MVSIPFWFKIFLGFFILSVLGGAFRYVFKTQLVEILKSSPPLKKKRKIRSYLWQVKLFKIFTLLAVAAIPIIIYFYINDVKDWAYIAIALFASWLFLVDDYFHKKKLIKELQASLANNPDNTNPTDSPGER